jgi:hypothetical protein
MRWTLGLGPVTVHVGSLGRTVALTHAALFPEVTTHCIAVSAFAIGEKVDEGEGCEPAAAVEATLARLNVPRTSRDCPVEVEDMLATVLQLYTAYPDRPDVCGALEGSVRRSRWICAR